MDHLKFTYRTARSSHPSRKVPLAAFCRYGLTNTHGCMTTKFRHRKVVDDADVAGNAHLVHIESLSFNRRFHTKSDSRIDQFENDKSEESNDDAVCSNANGLCDELRSIAIEQAFHG